MSKRVSLTNLIRLSARLSERDFAILETIDRLGFVTANQIERVHFFDSKTRNSAGVTRRRLFNRYVNERLVMSVVRNRGGADRWSNQQIYALDRVGEQIMRQRQGISGAYRDSRLSLPALQHIDHVLDVSEIYVRLVEASRVEFFRIPAFVTEPASWWTTSDKKTIKPDAYTELAAHGYADYWWIEVDRGNKSIPALVDQLGTYVTFFGRGEGGPFDVIPNVLVTVPDETRCAALTDALNDEKDVPDDLITVTAYDAAVGVLVAHLHAPSESETTKGN